MEQFVTTKLQEKEDSFPHPDDDRSTNKVKIRDLSSQDDTNMLSYDLITPSDDEPIDEEPIVTESINTGTSSKVSPPSFKDMLPNQFTGHSGGEEDLEFHKGDINIDKIGPIPSIAFSPRIHKLLSDSMKYAVVVKMLGGYIRYDDLRNNMLSLWKLIGTVQVTDVEGNCFIAKLSSKRDYHEVLLGGPWVIFSHYLMVQPWSPNFSPHLHTSSKVLAWIKIPGLPTKYYKKNVIRAIGEVLGTVMRIDHNTASRAWGKFA
ncbi:uncharacterized protein LOC114739596 [Neltuma alba]|uniref:uncharacterized protein LOC114739596 n=1 Tax=Neltuma alba TaxID=207710 RepID=UPI0010A3B1AC|nr:uncharacterized protein LOC114739596 [Prosopis alba]